MQKLSLDPELWAKTRRMAFDRQTTASKIVAEALTEWFGRQDGGGKLRAQVATHAKPIARVTSITETDGGLTVTAERIDEIPPVVSAGAVIVTPEDAASRAREIAARKNRPFTPVPKPTSSRRRSR